MCRTQPVSPVTTSAAPLASIARALRSAMALAMGGTPGGALNSPPKPQQDFGVGQRLDLSALDLSQQRARLFVRAQHAQLLAGRLVRDLAVEVRAHAVGHAQHVHQELAQLVGAGSHGLGPALPLGLVGQQPRVLLAHVGHADRRGRDDGRERLEDLDPAPGQVQRLRPPAGLMGQRAAAGLLQRELDAQPLPFQQRDRRLAHLRPVQIDQAGDEEGDGGG